MSLWDPPPGGYGLGPLADMREAIMNFAAPGNPNPVVYVNPQLYARLREYEESKEIKAIDNVKRVWDAA